MRSMKNTNLLLGALAVVIIVVGAFFVYGPFNKRAGEQKGPTEPALQVTLGSFIDARLTELKKGALENVSFSEAGSIVARSRRHDIGSAITILLRPNELGGTLVLETPQGQGNQTLSAPFSVKDMPTLSFDGSMVAYAALAVPPNEALYSEKVSDWHVHTFDVASGEDKDLGVGFAPYFISQSPAILLFSSPDGLVTVNTETGERSVFADRKVTNTTHAARVSPDGSRLAAYSDLTRRYGIFDITSPQALQVSAVGSIGTALESLALSNRYVFGVNRDEASGTFTLLRYAFDSITAPDVGEVIHTFSTDELPYQLVP